LQIMKRSPLSRFAAADNFNRRRAAWAGVSLVPPNPVIPFAQWNKDQKDR